MPSDALVLGFDTSAAHCAAALLRGELCIAQRSEDMGRGQAERLMPLIEELLAEAGVSWRDLDAIGVGVGPGNFTGVRISVAAARGLALSLGIPAHGVSRFDSEVLGTGGPVLVALDARQGKIYLQGFLDGAATSAPALEPLEGLAAPATPVIGDAAAHVAEATGATVLGAAQYPIAEAIARIAAARLASAAAAPRPAPLYMRAADAAPPSDPPPVILD
ncbi:tRNA (adenosine(37)-N6)-threonylcarbamoyltransferase complex dimerization subunit type 1 TsaB [Sedimentimonas flavescens]|uniref:tRNA (Adenosine(37)-N6)-threonylcarbamoyltransferase complex dimerization subunit type 1 TsaB n=1 Tax=Sedimentimonas flavescens TaxID=2851012 RepID=A0ABT2ZUK7_9RHOB|nr:tRNA (adenosine(37)-N6)-threonylcarbamoyltransferase complex dimerization subunit type 1 TsaB [Sedimentimonas flavescens]MCV2877311.1 tRNA (adenosine(37)-N6)-threonylcarbamoyltransferase complex dimerization subunit type 1 TsaB [Sedimentimonas flavescens]WBL32662.1 tRNA (adenosine(37)-N6)-threonylcarbamoyltransferase complex dimerization subunit type 1 TsaB [Sinirhodobacter sp. HNIBRBA609]